MPNAISFVKETQLGEIALSGLNPTLFNHQFVIYICCSGLRLQVIVVCYIFNTHCANQQCCQHAVKVQTEHRGEDKYGLQSSGLCTIVNILIFASSHEFSSYTIYGETYINDILV